MTWTCDQIEAQLSDYIEGLLPASERSEFEAHAAQCPECAPLIAGVRNVVTNLHSMEQVEVSSRLVQSILNQTLGPQEKVTRWQTLQNLIRGLATPKFAYGVASVMATFLILFSASGISLRKPKLADLEPSNVFRNVDRRYHLAKAGTVKYFSDLRVVYEIQSRLRQDQNELQVTPDESTPKVTPENKEPGQSDDRSHQQKQQNRANEIGRQFEMLAAQCPAVLERSFR